ncbi:aconitate hydratase X predicted [Vibrio ponticus]|nr:aconitate hydratase X predicted [Vibrio ponticus]
MVELSYIPVLQGKFDAELVCSQQAISFVGGVDIETGKIADHRHDCFGQSIKDKVFAFPFGKGSSGAGLVLMEMLRLGTAPKAIINLRTDPVLLTGPLICQHFYQQIVPIINLSEADYQQLASGKWVSNQTEDNKLFIKAQQ